MKSLSALESKYSKTDYQLELLEEPVKKGLIPSFRKRISEAGLFPLKPTHLDIFQMNLGKMCNQVCKHCHVDAGPDRKEIMTRETMQQCLDILAVHDISTVDLTGGAPEMNPDFRWFVEELSKLGKHIIVRCNLTIILANPKYHDLPEFYKKHGVEVVSSLPYFTKLKTDSQRGSGVFEKSIEALEILNKVGYGVEGTGLKLNLVYNPSGAFLPDNQQALENEFKKKLKDRYNLVFNNLFAITNLPISRFLDYLESSGNYDEYMVKLSEAYNATATEGVMCRNTLSIGWDGYMFDCDFNQMLDMKIDTAIGEHIKDFDLEKLNARSIKISQHCYGCTAGAGSSCGGQTA